MLNVEKMLTDAHTNPGIVGTWANDPERCSEMRIIASVLNLQRAGSVSTLILGFRPLHKS